MLAAIHAAGAMYVVIALDRTGCMSVPGLEITARAWHDQTIRDDTHWATVNAISRQIVESLHATGLAKAKLTRRDFRLVFEHWTCPLGELDLEPVHVRSEDLQAERDQWLAAQW